MRPLTVSRFTLAVAAAVLLALAVPAAEVRTTVTETFEDGTNEGGWTFGTGGDLLIDAGGNPGRYLRDPGVVTFTPRASTSFGVASAFTGDYRARGVESVGIDLAVADVDGGVSGRTLTLILLNDNDTPDDLSDDWGAYLVTDLAIPKPGVIGFASEADILGWESYDIPVPSRSGGLPDGWTWVSGDVARPGGPWARLMRDVDHVGFVLGDPALLYPLFRWDVAMDNPRITTAP